MVELTLFLMLSFIFSFIDSDTWPLKQTLLWPKSTVGKKMAVVNVNTIPCKPKTAYNV